MKRRSFLQWCLGVLGVGTAGVSVADEMITATGTEPVQDWRSMAGVNPEMLGDPPYCGDCFKCWKGKCWDNPAYPEPAEVTNTACFYYNTLPQSGVHLCHFRDYRLVAYRNILQWTKVGEPNEPLLGKIELDTIDVCRDLYVNPISPLMNMDEHVLWRGERELWRINYVGGELVFQFVLCGFI